MVDKNQKMRYNREELKTIRATLKDNEELIYALRKFFFQLELSEAEWLELKKIKPEFIQVLRKEFLGGVEFETPLLMTFDPFVFKEIITNSREDVYYLAEGKMLVLEYFEQSLDALEFGKEEIIKLESLKPKKGQAVDERYVNIYARNVIISVVENALNDFKHLSLMPEEETGEEREKKLAKNSNK